MYLKHIPNILKPLAKDLTFDLPNDENKIYLTFDDGPHAEITPWVLDQLDLYQAKATFFLIGKQIEAHPELVNEHLKRGHSIGNHTQSHLSGWKTKLDKYLKDVTDCQQQLDSRLFRPPYGEISREQAKALKHSHEIILWSSLSADFDQNYSADDCFRFATEKVRSGSIIVFHDSEKAWPRLKDCLPDCLSHYQKMGFKMEAIPMH